MNLVLGKTKCNFAGWGSISKSVDRIVIDNELKELKNEPVMESDRCTARLFFRFFDVKTSYKFDELIKGLKDENQDVYDRPKKFTFCIDLKKGCNRGIGKVSVLC